MKALTLFAAATALAGALAPEALADGRTPGSLLVYPIHRSGLIPPNTYWFTILCVTNTNTNPVTPVSFGGSTYAHFEYYNVTPNQADPFKPLGCAIFDRVEFLTPADTLCVLTSCHNAFGTPGGAPGQEGFVTVTAEDPSQSPGNAWDHDFLIGSELVMAASGASYMLDAIPFDALTGSPAATNGLLQLDGNNYEGVPDQLYGDFVAATNSRLTMINLTGGPSLCNQLYFAVYNDDERPLSATLRFNCWFDQPLSAVNPLFAESFLERVPNNPTELDITCNGVGDLETGWFCVDSQGVFFTNGQRFDNTTDGAVLGAITAGPGSVHGGRLLAESKSKQLNGTLRTP